MLLFVRMLITFLFVLSLASCTNTPSTKGISSNACVLTETYWFKPPEDSAVLDSPVYSYYFVNEDSSILASASWVKEEKSTLNVSQEWIKVGWFQPAGVDLIITGKRLDGDAPPLESETSCCYPTRFQATGLYFPTGGCWEVTAKAAESQLSFIVWVEP
jgi:hypothetical protein